MTVSCVCVAQEDNNQLTDKGTGEVHVGSQDGIEYEGILVIVVI